MVEVVEVVEVFVLTLDPPHFVLQRAQHCSVMEAGTGEIRSFSEEPASQPSNQAGRCKNFDEMKVIIRLDRTSVSDWRDVRRPERDASSMLA